MACARQTVPLKGGAPKRPYSIWISFPSFSSLERGVSTKGKLSFFAPDLKRRRAAAEGAVAVRCRLLAGEKWVITGSKHRYWALWG